MSRRAIAGWLLGAALLFTAALVAFVLGAGRYLEAPSTAPVKSDLLVSLGGDNGARAVRTLELYGKGYAPRILITGPDGGHPDIRAFYQEWRAAFFVKKGIPEVALLFDRRSANTWEEAVATLELMRKMKLDSVLVVSDPPHMRRLSWVWSRVFEGSGKRYTLVASDLREWDADYWWRTSAGAQYVFAETIKLAYYVMQY